MRVSQTSVRHIITATTYHRPSVHFGLSCRYHLRRQHTFEPSTVPVVIPHPNVAADGLRSFRFKWPFLHSLMLSLVFHTYMDWIELAEGRDRCRALRTFEFHEMRGISWLAENRLASQEGLCSKEWISKQASSIHLLVPEVHIQSLNWCVEETQTPFSTWLMQYGILTKLIFRQTSLPIATL